jgi:hypothetical protein
MLRRRDVQSFYEKRLLAAEPPRLDAPSLESGNAWTCGALRRRKEKEAPHGRFQRLSSWIVGPTLACFETASAACGTADVEWNATAQRRSLRSRRDRRTVRDACGRYRRSGIASPTHQRSSALDRHLRHVLLPSCDESAEVPRRAVRAVREDPRRARERDAEPGLRVSIWRCHTARKVTSDDTA